MKNLIDYAYNDNGTEFRDALYSAIHDKVATHIEAKKQEIASGLMGQQFEEEFELDEEVELEESFFGRIKSVPEIISAVKAANNGDIEGMKHHAKKYAEKQSSDSSKHAELQKKIYSHLAQKSTHPSSRAVAKALSEEFESLDEISVDKIVKYSDKAQKSYADPETSPEKKANRMKGLTTGYQKLKARAKVPATYNEEFESLDEMENYEAVTAARDAHVKTFMDKTGLPEAHAKQYHAAVVKYPNNAMAGAEQAANRIAGPQVKGKFHQAPKTYQDKHIAHVKTMKGIMNP